MVKQFNTFEEAHEHAIKAMQRELAARLGSEDVTNCDWFWRVLEAYTSAMGYEPMSADYGDRFFEATCRALRREAKNKRSLPFSELLERIVRAGVIAIGERWPNSKPCGAEASRGLNKLPGRTRPEGVVGQRH